MDSPNYRYHYYFLQVKQRWSSSARKAFIS